MQTARRLVGHNELEMSRDNAMVVFKSHGGQFDQDMAPILGPCKHPHCSERYHFCQPQRLAFSILLALSTFETSQEMLVEQVMQRIAREMR